MITIIIITKFDGKSLKSSKSIISLRTGWHWGLNITAIFYTSKTTTTICLKYCVDGFLDGTELQKNLQLKISMSDSQKKNLKPTFLQFPTYLNLFWLKERLEGTDVNQESNSLNNGHLKYVNSHFKLILFDLKVSTSKVLDTS